MRTEHFKTIMSDDTFFTNQILDVSSYAGQIGQWQNGVPQVIDVGAKRTKPPIYPEAALAGAESLLGSTCSQQLIAC